MENKDKYLLLNIKTEPEPNSNCDSSIVEWIKLEDSSSMNGLKVEDNRYNNTEIKVEIKDVKHSVKLETEDEILPNIKQEEIHIMDEILTDGIDQAGCDIHNGGVTASLQNQNQKSINIQQDITRRREFFGTECRFKTYIHKEVYFTCELCDFKTAHRSCLTRHVKTHTGEKPFECHFCNFKTARRRDLMRHVKTHTGEKPYACTLCNYKAIESCNLKVHIKRVHSNVKPFACNWCKFKSAKKYCLEEHIKRFHNNGEPYLCNLCNFKTLRNSCLQRHMNAHKSKKSFAFACNLCKYKAVRGTDLEIHMQIHTGETPYQCNLCEFGAAKKTDLVKHLASHYVAKK